MKEGVIVSKLAAHAADIAKGIKGAIDKDIQMAKCRKALDWNGQIALSLNPEKVKKWRAEIPPTESEVCSMCGEFCAIRTVERALKKEIKLLCFFKQLQPLIKLPKFIVSESRYEFSCF